MKEYRIRPNTRVDLSEWDANETAQFMGSKKEGMAATEKLNKKLEELQEMLYAEHKQRVLIVIQALDTGGKDGVICSVFDGVNPQGVKVASFKAPTPEELDHDYLWRIHKHTPGKGEIVIFNRSHYEEVLVVRVHNLTLEKTWKKRFQHIRDFERMLSDEGTTILKFYLHIDQEEQRKRLLERINDPAKRWKFNPGDLEERKLWKQYVQAFEDVLSKTSTPWAPWYVIPANRNWYRNYLISTILVETLEKMKMKFPETVEDLSQYALQLEGSPISHNNNDNRFRDGSDM
ncbi:MAG: polyphosphate kinase [Anaerolinea sp.]|nr:polyphosphate kinase [Anaerolinea sp.]